MIESPGALIEGQPPAYWLRKYFAWSHSFVGKDAPSTDTTGSRCTAGQSGPVWFLTGSESGNPVVRSCVIPAKVNVLVPILISLAQPTKGNSLSCKKIMGLLNNFSSEVSDLYLKIDGQVLKDISPYQDGTRCFDLNDIETGQKGLAAGDGYWVFLNPLPPGTHDIEFGGKYLTDGFTQNITYRITVQ